MLNHKIKQFLERSPLPTPFLVIDLDVVTENYRKLHQLYPNALIHYAVKANPESAVLKQLVQLGSQFDAASIYEIHQCLAAGAQPSQISYGNTIKKAQDIAQAYQLGIRQFSFDSPAELQKLATHAPSARVLCRLLIETHGAEWSLGRKFGCEPEMAVDLLLHSQQLGLVPEGLTFHVGSQQTDPDQWDAPIRLAADLFSKLALAGIDLSVLNLGGGFPAQYRAAVPEQEIYVEKIQNALHRYFGANQPQVMLEPGRSLVGDAGVLQTEVVLIAKKSYREDLRWVYLDVGKFNGLIETLDECIRYRIFTPHQDQPTGAVILAGPTCDSADILYEKSAYQLPLSLCVGDRIQILSTGAYTQTYSSVGFNGFPPLQVCCI